MQGPIKAKLTHEKTGKEYDVQIYLCDICKHVIKIYDMEGKDQSKNQQYCIASCKDCPCVEDIKALNACNKGSV